eukprot:12934881-Prorocentrum_lima.AAC.1
MRGGGGPGGCAAHSRMSTRGILCSAHLWSTCSMDTNAAVRCACGRVLSSGKGACCVVVGGLLSLLLFSRVVLPQAAGLA